MDEIKIDDRDILNINAYNRKTNPLIKYRLIENCRLTPKQADEVLQEIEAAQASLLDKDTVQILRLREEEMRQNKVVLLNILEAQTVLNKAWEVLVILYMFADENLTTPYLSLAEITNNKYFYGGAFKSSTVRRKLVELENAGYISEIARDMLPVRTTNGSKYDNFRLMFRLNFASEAKLLQGLVDSRVFVENAIKRRNLDINGKNKDGKPRKIDQLLWARQALYSKDEKIFLELELNEDRNGHASLPFNRQKTLEKKVKFRNKEFMLDDNEIYHLCVARLNYINKGNNVDLKNALRVIKKRELNEQQIEALKAKLQGKDPEFYVEVNKRVEKALNTYLDPENPVELPKDLTPDEMIEYLKEIEKTVPQLRKKQERYRVEHLNDLKKNSCIKLEIRKNLTVDILEDEEELKDKAKEMQTHINDLDYDEDEDNTTINY